MLPWIFALPTSARAFSCPRPTPWYIQTITLELSALPAGVRMSSGGPDPEPAIYLVNTSPRRIYLLGPRSAHAEIDLLEQPALSVTLPAGMIVVRQILPTGLASHPDLTMYPDKLSLYVPDWDRRGDRTGPHRDDTSLPPPQHGQFTFVYGDALLVVPLTATYGLNSAYDPAQPVPECRGVDPSTLLLLPFLALMDGPNGEFLRLVGMAVQLIVIYCFVVAWVSRTVRRGWRRHRR